MVGTIVVAAVADNRRHAIGIAISPHKMVAACLACTIGAVGVVSGGFGKQPGIAQGSVNFIGTYMVKSFAQILPGPVFFGSFQQVDGAIYIGIYKIKRAQNAAVHVAFGCQVNNIGNTVSFKNLCQGSRIEQVGMAKSIVWSVFNIGKVGQVACIGKGIKVYNAGSAGIAAQKAELHGCL